MSLSFQLDKKAKDLASQYLICERELLSVLMDMDEKKIFLSLGFSGIFNYCRNALHFSESQAGYFSSIARKSRVVPELGKAVVSGELSISQARRLLSVINPRNQEEWIQKAGNMSQKQLEKEVATQNPRVVEEKIKPVAENRHLLRLGVSDRLLEKWERARSILSKKEGRVINLEETLEGIVDIFLLKDDPVEKAKRSALRSEPAAKPNVASQPADFSRDGRKPIPAKVKHEVNLRDGGNCTVPGCANNIFTELHHVKPVSHGGQNTVENIFTTCSAHHRLIHHRNEQSLQSRGNVGAFRRGVT